MFRIFAGFKVFFIYLLVLGDSVFAYPIDSRPMQTTSPTPFSTSTDYSSPIASTTPTTSPTPSISQAINVCRAELGEYCAYTTCSNYSNCTHVACNNLGLDCRTLDYQCQGSGHSLNLIKDPLTGLWHLVDPTAETDHTDIVFTDPQFVSIETVCFMLGIEDCSTCEMSIHQDPQPPTTTYTCAVENYNRGNRGRDLKVACYNCCDKFAANPNVADKPDKVKWQTECRKSCDNWAKM